MDGVNTITNPAETIQDPGQPSNDNSQYGSQPLYSPNVSSSDLNIHETRNPIAPTGDLSGTAGLPKNDLEKTYLDQRMQEVSDTMRQIPQSMRDELPEAIRSVTPDQIKKAEIDAIHGTENTDFEKYEAILFAADAWAELSVHDAMDATEAHRKFATIRSKTGEILQQEPKQSQKAAAALAIASLADTDPEFMHMDPKVYGAFHAWALANIELNRVEEERRVALKAAHMEKIKQKMSSSA